MTVGNRSPLDTDTSSGAASVAVQLVTRIPHKEALLKASALQHAIFNSSSFYSIATDEKGVIQIFNVGAERMLGYAAGEVIDKITPADIADAQEVIARAEALTQELGTTVAPGFDALVWKAARGIEDIYELTYIRKDGTRFPAVGSVTALRGPDDGIIGYLLIGTDNTARKQAEAEREKLDQRLRDQQFYTRSLIESNIDALMTTDPRGIITDVNKQMEALTGCTRAELIGAPFKSYFTDPERAEAAIERVMNETTISNYELTALARDGRRTDVSYNASTFHDRNRKLQGVFAAARDVTERKRSDDLSAYALRELNDLKAALDEHAIVAITNSRGMITYVNDKFCAISKYSREELLGRDHRIINSGFHPKEFIRSLWQTISDGRVWKGEIKNKAKDGTFFWEDTTIVPYLGEDGRPIQYIAIRADITNHKLFERALQDSNAALEGAKSVAEKANLAKSAFLSSMSHELRSPLNAILGFAQLMESTSPLPVASQAKSIAQILQAGWHLLKLINEILDLAAIESGKVALSLEPVSLAEVMAECQTMVEQQAKQRGIHLTFPGFDHPSFVWADRTRLKQIVINLLSNAIKFNKDQGTVVVDCVETAPERTRISVTDTGTGLSAEQLAQLFQPFNRLGQRAGSVAGTGIGLVVTKQLAELMQGVLGVESSTGVGSKFWIELPSSWAPRLAGSAREPAAPVQPQPPSDRRLRTLLYIEDNPANMELVEQLIARRSDLRLLTAVNGTLGVELARASQPEVILMDINLPGISGIDALKILHEDPATAHIPVVALSANAMPRDVELGIEGGFFRYITKPIKVKEFMDTLDVALECARKPVDPRS